MRLGPLPVEESDATTYRSLSLWERAGVRAIPHKPAICRHALSEFGIKANRMFSSGHPPVNL